MSKRNTSEKQQQLPVSDQALKDLKNMKISGNLEDTITIIDSLLGMNADFLKRRFHVFGQYPAAVFYYSSMTNSTMINSEILKPLMYPPPSLESESIAEDQLKSILFNDSLYHSGGQLESSISILVDGILLGKTIVVVDKLDEAFLVHTRSLDKGPSISRRRSKSSVVRVKGSLRCWIRISHCFAIGCQPLIFTLKRWRSVVEANRK